MLRINHDYLEVFVGCILVHPVRVKYSQVRALLSSTLLSDRLQISGKFKLVDTLMFWFTINNTLWVWAFATTTAYSDAVQTVTLLNKLHSTLVKRVFRPFEKEEESILSNLLSFETKSVSFISSGRAMNFSELWHLSIFPCPNTEQKAQHIALLFPPKLF